MTRLRILILAALGCVPYVQAADEPLTINQVLETVDRHYPPLLATLLESDLADAEVLQALGRFDLVLGAQLDTDQFGKYTNERVSVGFDQAFQNSGASAYGGWRLGDGKFAPYAGALDTRSYGEWRGGVKLPLAKNRSIDDRRGNLQKAEIGRRIAGLSIDQQRLVIRQLASRRYWDWVSAGQRLRIARDILRVAQERDRALREASELGQIPPIEVTENRRQILQRQAQLVEAQRGLQQASIDLSLYYRPTDGKPETPGETKLPPRLPGTETLTDIRVVEDLDSALRRRPEIERLTRQKDQAMLDVRLAENDRKPALDLSAGFTAESGAGAVSRGPSELKASLRFELPVQRRAAAGKLQAARAKATQIEQRERFTRDQVEAEVKDAAGAVRAAHERALLARDEVRVAVDLAEAERERFRLGDSTLFTVNLREQAAVDAELREVSAVNDYLRAITLYDQVTARLLHQS
jgi:cobalt-zinc-cadmium efflux system outer membrane protein